MNKFIKDMSDYCVDITKEILDDIEKEGLIVSRETIEEKLQSFQEKLKELPADENRYDNGD